MGKIKLGEAAEKVVEGFINRYGEGLGDLSEILEKAIGQFLTYLKIIPFWAFILGCGLLVLVFKRKILLSLFVLAGLSLIYSLGHYQEMLETLVMVGLSTFISVTLGVPLGLLAAKKKWVDNLMRPLLDLMQTIPTFVYLIPTLMIFGLGVVPGVVSTVVFALPAPIRLTYLGIKNVPSHLVEVGRSFGANAWQVLWKIELPHARPMLMAGISQCIMLSLSMVVIAALVGADGLGRPVVQALNTVNIGKGFEAGISIVIMAIILDRVLKRRTKGGQGHDHD